MDFHFRKKKILEDVSPWGFNWSVWDYEEARVGDRFFMLKVGETGNNGIVMSGVFCSRPYEGEDWSGKDRLTFYVDVVFDIVVDPASDKVLGTSALTELLPSIEWTKGHSGVLIEEDAALKLEKAWYAHLKSDLSTCAKAKEVAHIAHFGQKDKAGQDYWFHPMRVARNFSGKEEVVAWLHDVVEDSEFTLDDLASDGFPPAVIKGVNAMSRREEETYEAFIKRVARNKIARAVKMADLKDNLNLLRLPELREEDLERIWKYHRAYRYLEGL